MLFSPHLAHCVRTEKSNQESLGFTKERQGYRHNVSLLRHTLITQWTCKVLLPLQVLKQLENSSVWECEFIGLIIKPKYSYGPDRNVSITQVLKVGIECLVTFVINFFYSFIHNLGHFKILFRKNTAACVQIFNIWEVWPCFVNWKKGFCRNMNIFSQSKVLKNIWFWNWY